MSYFNQYLESRVLSASPIELVRLTYRGTLDATNAARQHFASGDIPARTQALNRAAALVTELVTSLRTPLDTAGPPSQGLALEQNLRRLYDYVLHQFAQAAIEQNPQPLDQADAILRSLLESWERIEPESHAAPPPDYASSKAISVSA
jgi:flagellar protein FliS